MSKRYKIPLISGTIMKQLREAAGLSQRELSKVTEVSCSEISKMECGRGVLSEAKFYRIYNYLLKQKST